MISKEELDAIRKKTRLKPYQQESHYIQGLMLFLLKEEPIVFKGGTCLWYFYGLPRYSEDLDFTAVEEISDDIHENLSANLIRVFGVMNNTTIEGKIRDGSTSFKTSVKGPYFDPMKTSGSTSTIQNVKVEISRRENMLLRPLPAMFDHPEYKIQSTMISCMSAQEIACEKVRAVMTRDKPRDVFDPWYIITKLSVVFDEEMVNEKLSMYKIKYQHEDFVKRVNKKDKFWEKDLKQMVLIELPLFQECADVVIRWARSKI